MENNIFFVWVFCAALVALLFASIFWIKSLKVENEYLNRQLQFRDQTISKQHAEKTKLQSRIDFLLKLCPEEMRKKYRDHFNPFKK